MTLAETELLPDDPRSLSERLNAGCLCIMLDRTSLDRAVEEQAGEADFVSRYVRTRPNLFSNVPMFLSESDIRQMMGVVRAVAATVRHPAYRALALAQAPEIARHDFGPLGAFMGYDFHITSGGPRLIEINTNAGGAFLNALLVKAHRACCPEIGGALTRLPWPDFDRAVVDMFRAEWERQCPGRELRRVAIVDDSPQDQYLYPEFVLAQKTFQRSGIESVIVDAKELAYADGRLRIAGEPVDLVYNRLVDFSLEQPEHSALRQAYGDGNVVVTPNPHIHALYADKRNLVTLSDRSLLRAWGLSGEMLNSLERVPRTVSVTSANAAQLWDGRRGLFFKPVSGYGSKAVYRGDKLTKSVWNEILAGGYVAQELAPPSARTIEVDGSTEIRKVDVRVYVYGETLLIAAARLYQGQTTNFRTVGGGFAPVFVV